MYYSAAAVVVATNEQPEDEEQNLQTCMVRPRRGDYQQHTQLRCVCPPVAVLQPSVSMSFLPSVYAIVTSL